MIRLSLDRVMKEKNLTQKEIIELTGISRNTVKALAANASTRIDFPTLDALCKGLGVTPSDLIEYFPD
ncbi:helix-turn-helix domain-containing protein [Paenibacillus ehimensis]|uniref:Helix-turn-helix transcriptional regulator n=1 Tax=Paenibacillus ehimensis TaxID=79264 RepID=A0ABT8VMI9_9BACL|nr:helix-turn-helix transcriptional regulator [Paenibacillus ehimensis]MDO3682172.1 helix-turn-helix transcriptional regulator [Paenibacillus ehimensis]